MKRALLFFSVLLCLSGAIVFSRALTLPQAQNMMLYKNLDIIIANQEYCKKDLELEEAKSIWRPSVDLDGMYGFQNKKNTISLPFKSPLFPSGPLEIGTYDRSDVGLDVSWPITAALVNIYNVKYRTMALQIKSAQNAALKNQLSLALGALYLTWDFSYAQTSIRQKLVAQLESSVAQLKTLLAGGLVAASKVLEAQAKVENEKVLLCAAENQTDSLRLELVNFLQCPDSALAPEPYDFGASVDSLAAIDTPSLDGFRPELAALDLAADQMSASMDMLSGQKYPNLVWTAGYHYGRPELNMGNDPKYMGYAMTALQMKFNLYDGDKVASQQRQTQQQIEITYKQKQRLVNSFNNAIKAAKRDLIRARRQLQAAEISLEASRALTQDAKNSLDGGIITPLEYLAAVTAEASAQCTVKQARFLEKMALLKVYFATGKELKY